MWPTLGSDVISLEELSLADSQPNLKLSPLILNSPTNIYKYIWSLCPAILHERAKIAHLNGMLAIFAPYHLRARCATWLYVAFLRADSCSVCYARINQEMFEFQLWKLVLRTFSGHSISTDSTQGTSRLVLELIISAAGWDSILQPYSLIRH